MAASRRHDLGLEHHDYAADASGRESGGGAHRGGGATMGRNSGSAWRRPHRREGRRRLRLAPGAAGEDEGGEGGLKMENGGGLGGSHHWGKNGDGGIWKHVGEGRGGSIAGVDERRFAWPCGEESEGGEKKRRAR
jgi:hypothetical protein